jgi:putative membrane protein
MTINYGEFTMKHFLFVSAAIIAMPLAASAQVSAPSASPMAQESSSANASLSLQDQDFIKLAAISGMSEIDDGNLATSKGDPSVKALGTMMVSDHTKANDQLLAIAKQKGVTPPMQVDAKHVAITAKLKTLSGAAFDHEYLSTELTGHEMTIAVFKAEISKGSDADLKAFASATLPILEHHLSMVEAARK